MYRIEEHEVVLNSIKVTYNSDDRERALVFLATYQEEELTHAASKDFLCRISPRFLDRYLARGKETISMALARSAELNSYDFIKFFIEHSPATEQAKPTVAAFVETLRGSRDVSDLWLAEHEKTLIPKFQITGSGETVIYHNQWYPLCTISYMLCDKEGDFHYMKIENALLHVSTSRKEPEITNQDGRVHIYLPAFYLLEEEEMKKAEDIVRKRTSDDGTKHPNGLEESEVEEDSLK